MINNKQQNNFYVISFSSLGIPLRILLFKIDKYVLWAENFRIVDIEINAWSHLFVNITFIYIYPRKCLKLNQECGFYTQNSQFETGKFITHSMREFLLVGSQQGYPKEINSKVFISGHFWREISNYNRFK